MKAHEQSVLDSGRSLMDMTGGVLSLVCIVHCLALPLAFSLGPFLNLALVEDALFHSLMLMLVLPVSVLALSIGCRQHKQLPSLLLGTAGLSILTFTALFGHDLLGLVGERLVTSAGGLALALAHLLNYRACRQASCQHSAEPRQP